MFRRPQTYLASMLLGLSPMAYSAENIDVLMSRLFQQDDLTYIGFDSVERVDIPESSGVDRKYLIVDFRSNNPDSQDTQVARVHEICSTLLGNRDLIRDLTHEGYDMVSVAFDRNYQYDCLP